MAGLSFGKSHSVSADAYPERQVPINKAQHQAYSEQAIEFCTDAMRQGNASHHVTALTKDVLAPNFDIAASACYRLCELIRRTSTEFRDEQVAAIQELILEFTKIPEKFGTEEDGQARASFIFEVLITAASTRANWPQDFRQAYSNFLSPYVALPQEIDGVMAPTPIFQKAFDGADLILDGPEIIWATTSTEPEDNQLSA